MNKEEKILKSINETALKHEGDILVFQDGLYVLFMDHDPLRIAGTVVAANRALALIDNVNILMINEGIPQAIIEKARSVVGAVLISQGDTHVVFFQHDYGRFDGCVIDEASAYSIAGKCIIPHWNLDHETIA